MYTSRKFEPDNMSFDEDIEDLDACRDTVLKGKTLASYDVDYAIMCSAGHDALPSRNSCDDNCSVDDTDEDVVIIDDSKKFKVNFNADIQNNKVNAVSWKDIDEATDNDRKLNKIRNALKSNDKETLEGEIKGLTMSDNPPNADEIVKTRSGVKIEDLSLYKNCILIRDRIWVPEDLRRAFYNNLHLGHRSVDIMMRLALRSSFWVNIKEDLQHFYNDCSTCIANQDKNKKLPKIPEVEVREPCQQLTMDIGKTPANEHILAITDRFTGYVWAAKTGDNETGTSEKCIEILKSKIGAGLYNTESIKCDQGAQLISHEMQEFLDNKGIKLVTSSAYNPTGNLLAENGIRRIKRAIGRETIEDAFDDIEALNHSSPYSNEIQSPFEAMYKFTPKPINLPRPEFLRTGDTTIRKNHKDERNIKPYGCTFEGGNFDRDNQTMKERLIDKFWAERIHDRPGASLLDPGDNIYYRDRAIRGFGRWKPGIIIDRKGEDENNGRIIKLKGYDILDTVTGKHTTRTREDIRIRKRSRLEEKIYKDYVEFLNRMHSASNERGEDEEYKKPLFKETYAESNPDNIPTPEIAPGEDPPEPTPGPTTEGTTPEPTTKETTTTPAPENQSAPPQQRKPSREEKNLHSDLGDYWQCTDHDPHWDGQLGRRLRTRVTKLNNKNRHLFVAAIKLELHNIY